MLSKLRAVESHKLLGKISYCVQGQALYCSWKCKVYLGRDPSKVSPTCFCSHPPRDFSSRCRMSFSNLPSTSFLSYLAFKINYYQKFLVQVELTCFLNFSLGNVSLSLTLNISNYWKSVYESMGNSYQVKKKKNLST